MFVAFTWNQNYFLMQTLCRIGACVYFFYYPLKISTRDFLKLSNTFYIATQCLMLFDVNRKKKICVVNKIRMKIQLGLIKVCNISTGCFTDLCTLMAKTIRYPRIKNSNQCLTTMRKIKVVEKISSFCDIFYRHHGK